jgi:hypothetical protein
MIAPMSNESFAMVNTPQKAKKMGLTRKLVKKPAFRWLQRHSVKTQTLTLNIFQSTMARDRT